MSTEDAKAYLSTREVPRLFECLMTGLMFHRPNDHIQYLIDSLEKVKDKGQAELTWNMFVEVRSAKTPLPPITPDNGKRPTSRGRITPKEEPRPLTPSKTTPLPPIGSSGLPNVPVIFVMGGPGSGKSTQANKLAEKHPGWVNIHIGELLRNEIKNKGAEEKWKAVKDLVISGELAPEDVTLNLLLNCFKKNTEANGFIIQGFPRDMEQAQAFEKTISRVDAVFLLDSEEDKLTDNVLARGQRTGRLDDAPGALARRMATFKDRTLPVLKYYDDGGKLYIVDGEQEEETIHDELSIIFETLLQNMENGRIPSPPAGSRPSSARRSQKSATLPVSSPTPEPPVSLKMPEVAFIPPPDIKVKDEGRKPDLPRAPIVFLAGGPGSGKGTQCEKITARYPDIVHLSMGDILRKEISEQGSADEKWDMITKLLQQGDMAPMDVTEELLIKSMKEHPNARAYLVEGYPRDAMQYEAFNRNIGGHTFTILLDCDDQYLQDRLILRGGRGSKRIDDSIPAIEKKLAFFSRNSLPLYKAIEDEDKLIVIDGDRDEEEIFYDIVKCLDFSLYGVQLDEGAGDEGGKAEGTEEEEGGEQAVVEEQIVATTAVLTGDNDGNPEHTAQLDAAAEPAVQTQEVVEQTEKVQAMEEEVTQEETEEQDEAEEEQEIAQEAEQGEEQAEQSANQEEESTEQEVEAANEQAEEQEAVGQSEEVEQSSEQQANEDVENNEESANQNEEQGEVSQQTAEEVDDADTQQVDDGAMNENVLEQQQESIDEKSPAEESANQETEDATEESANQETEGAAEEAEQKTGYGETDAADTQKEESGETNAVVDGSGEGQVAEESAQQKEEEQGGEKTAEEQGGEKTAEEQGEEKKEEEGSEQQKAEEDKKEEKEKEKGGGEAQAESTEKTD